MPKSNSILNIDIVLLLSTLALMLVGVLFIYSSGVTSAGTSVSDEYVKQLIWVLVGVVLIIALNFTNYNILKEWSFYLYLFFLAILILTLFAGKVVNGSKSWFGLWGFGIQPSEFSKIATILFYSRFLVENQSRIKELKIFLLGFLIILIPMTIILRQPDLGTALVFLPMFFLMSFMAGSRPRHILFLVLFLVVTIFFTITSAFFERKIASDDSLLVIFSNPTLFILVVAGLFLITSLAFWGFRKYKRKIFYWVQYSSSILGLGLLTTFFLKLVLKEYQILRLILFLDPSIDPKGAGWNLIQSITAVGSGGAVGKGFLQGTQSHYRFLPMQSTDFIFSILAEEWGFLGGLVVFGLFSIILIRSLNIMNQTKDSFAVFTIAGFLAMFFTHVFVNVGMTMGIMPITGIPLYFLSYGGSSLIAGALAIGITLNIYHRRFMF